MSKIPQPQRQRLIDALSHSFGSAKLVIEGRKVSFEARMNKPLVYCLMPFVDGEFSGAWLGDPEKLDETGKLGRRLMRPRVVKLYGPKKLKELNRIRRLSGIEPITKEGNERTYFATWHCPKALVRHLEREFESIQIVEPEDAAA